ncbi:MAG: hypothetical protein Q7U82_09855 [Gammaproteobacteria bacterium]|nr:hypothetical protein [Gammaproteobacteria bacterium]MDO9318491.1 hypothetical protein [Gammaproteobacteria bacterium]
MSQQRVIAVMPVYKTVIALVLATALVSPLAGCASAGTSGRPLLQPPGYASVFEDNNFLVRCGTKWVSLPRQSIDHFFKEDGAEKTLREFCGEYRSGTLFRR